MDGQLIDGPPAWIFEPAIECREDRFGFLDPGALLGAEGLDQGIEVANRQVGSSGRDESWIGDHDRIVLVSVACVGDLEIQGQVLIRAVLGLFRDDQSEFLLVADRIDRFLPSSRSVSFSYMTDA